MNFIQAIVKQKLKQITPEQLLDLSSQYGIDLTANEANIVVKKLRNTHLNIFDEAQRKQLLDDLALLTSTETVEKAEKILLQQFGHYLN